MRKLAVVAAAAVIGAASLATTQQAEARWRGGRVAAGAIGGLAAGALIGAAASSAFAPAYAYDPYWDGPRRHRFAYGPAFAYEPVYSRAYIPPRRRVTRVIVDDGPRWGSRWDWGPPAYAAWDGPRWGSRWDRWGWGGPGFAAPGISVGFGVGPGWW